MKSFIFLIFYLFIIVIPLSAEEIPITTNFYDRYAPYQIATNKDSIWITYYDTEGSIRVKNPFITKDFIINEGRQKLSKRMAFNVQDDNIFVVWRDKVHDSKQLFFRAIRENGKIIDEPVLLDKDTTEALTRMKVASNSKGHVTVIWYGERDINKHRHHIYTKSSNDFGKTFLKIENQTLGYYRSLYPTILADDSATYIFSYSSKEGKQYMLFRKSIDGGLTWSEITEIKQIGVVTLFIEPIKINNRLHVFWFNSYDEIPVVEGAYSDDDGKSWKTFYLEDTRGLDISLLKVANDSKGNIYLAMSGKFDEKEKSKVYILCSNDNGNTWSKLTNLRHYPLDNTTAINPDILATDNGEVVVVWVDYRNIRSNIYMQYSKDGGKTWQANDIPLEEPGRFNTAIYPFRKSLVRIKDKFYLLAYRHANDEILEKANLLLIGFNLDKGGSK